MSNLQNYINNYNKNVKNCSTCTNNSYSQPQYQQNNQMMSYTDPANTYSQQRNNNYVTVTNQTTQNYKSKQNLFDLYKPIPKVEPPNVPKNKSNTYIIGAKKYN